MDDSTTPHPIFGPVLAELSEQDRDEVLAAFTAVEHSAAPVPEVQLLALRDATLRRALQRLLQRVGRTLVAVAGPAWTSGYRDDIAAELTGAGWNGLSVTDRAVLVLVLIHSVAIPRSRGLVSGDSWVSAQPTPIAELGNTKLQAGEVRMALQRLRASGLVQLAQSRGAAGTAYLPGPQLHRLTAVARKALEHELVLAAAPSSPLAAAIRARRSTSGGAL